MKSLPSFLLAALALAALAGTARAQIIWQTPQSITGSPSDISFFGKPFAAVGANNNGGPITIGDTTFNSIFSDSTITFSGAVGDGTDGSHSTATPYLTVLDDVAYVGFSPTPITATFTINDLIPGNEYQVQVWNPGIRQTDIIGSNTVDLASQFTLGTFIAGSSTQSFDFGPVFLEDAGEISAIDVRTIPEPSTYGMLLVGLTLLGYHLRRKRARIQI